MKIVIKMIIGIMQFISIILYVGIFKLLITNRSEPDFYEVLSFLIVVSVITQSVSLLLKKKYPLDFETTVDTLTKDRSDYKAVLVIAIVTIIIGIIIGNFLS